MVYHHYPGKHWIRSRSAPSKSTPKIVASFPPNLGLPAFSHSDNHVGLQMIDAICSAIMTPIAVHTYALDISQTCTFALAIRI